MKRMRIAAAHLATVLAGAALLGVPATVGATGIVVARFGNEKGNPTSAHPAAIYYNPANLAFLKGNNVHLEGLFALRLLAYDRDPRAIDRENPSADYTAASSGEGKLVNVIPSPFLAVTSDFGVENLGVGLAFFTPFGGQAKFDKNDAFDGNTQFPGAVDGSQRWHDIEGSIRASYVGAGAGYRLPFGLAVGASANLVVSVINDLRAYNPDGTDDMVDANGIQKEGRAWLEVSAITFSFGVGLSYTPPELPELTIGLSYQSQPGLGTHKLSGTVKRKVGLTDVATDNVEVEQAYPDIIRLGVAYRPTKDLELRLYGAFERWGVFESQCIANKDNPNHNCAIDDRGSTTAASVGVIANIPRNWKNSFNVNIGGSYQLNPDLELGAGLGYDGNAVPDEMLDISLPDFDDIHINVAATFALLEGNLHLTVAFTQFIYFSRTIAPQARDETGERTLYLPPTRVPDTAGKYSEAISLLTIGLGYHF